MELSTRLGIAFLLVVAGVVVGGERVVPRPADGYHGIWYQNQPQDDEYRFKYSGGLGTYPQQHEPIAYYSAAARKTFFVYGGASADGNAIASKRSLLIMVSYFDHATGRVPRPRILLDKKTVDAHDNPTIMLDSAGHVWVFAPSHGTARAAYIFRSVRPYDIDEFELVRETNFSYPQPWFLNPYGFMFLHTRYVEGKRFLHSMTSADGQKWTEPRLLACVENGHYQISWPAPDGKKLATAFNYHPTRGGLNARTNLYYMETSDGAQTWRTIKGDEVGLPLREKVNAALVRNYESEGRLVYLKDLNFDRSGHPVIVYVLSRGYKSGPESGPQEWMIAHWTGAGWKFEKITESDHNYDTGCLHVEKDGTWRLIAPTTPGPQRFNPGGEVVMWTSRDEGKTWDHNDLTAGSRFNHTYMRRPVNADPGFYALWADGDTREPSDSHLYFCNQQGQVFRLPWEMNAETAAVEPVRLTR